MKRFFSTGGKVANPGPAARPAGLAGRLGMLGAALFGCLLFAAPNLPAGAQPAAGPPAASAPATSSPTQTPAQTPGQTPGQTPAQTPGQTGEPGRAPEAPPVQAAAPPPPLPLAENAIKAQQDLERLNLLVGRIEAAAQRENLGDRELAQLRGELDPIRDQAMTIATAVAPLVKAVDERLAQLGPAPEASGTESEPIAAERTQQATLRETYDGIVKQARLLSLSAEQLSGRISERRRALFTDKIFERRDSALDYSLWIDVLKATPVAAARFWLLVSDWWGALAARINAGALAAIAGAVIVIGFGLPAGRRLLLRVGARSPARARPSRLRRASAAAWLTLVHVLVPALAVLFFYLPLNSFSLLPAPVDRLFYAGARAVLFFSLVQGLAWALLAPSRPTWRMVDLTDGQARRVLVMAVAAAAAYALDGFLDQVITITFAPLQLAVGKGVVASMLIAIFLAIALASARKIRQPGAPAIVIPARWRWLGIGAWAALFAIPLSAALGYLALANFIAAQLVIGVTILALLVLSTRLVDALLTEGLERRLEESSDPAATAKAHRMQAGIIASGVLRVLLALVALFFLAVPWGIESKDLFGWVRTAFFGFTIGSVTISLSSILLALAVFIAGIVITRSVQSWLEQSLLPHTRLDTGIRNSLKTAFGYAGIIIAAALGFTFAGLDLSNLAIVAGALSVGIGFGLQSIVNNFVSGLILLAERPIKDGDWIVVGAEEGFVSKISVRSTQIETFDRATVIIPNSDLISGVVKNWMHSNKMGRVRVAIGVAYNADPDQVREILLACAEQHPGVLKVPPPIVYLMNFGASSLDFELRAHIISVDTGMVVRSDLRFAILKALREAGIEIPFPQQDLHLRDIERLETALGGKAARKKAAVNAKPAAQKKAAGTPPAARQQRKLARDIGDTGEG
ncbi:MAG: mechanosensitive ion channel family protein [Rhodobiaceae bacterium]|nr:mechanosensitive ion channel family protein [Rhodobiaceae bacterium]